MVVPINLGYSCSKLGTVQNMAKKTGKKRGRYQKKDWKVPVLAAKYRVDPRFVRMVKDGERSHDAIFSDFMFLQAGENKLIEAVNKLNLFGKK